MSGKPKSKAAMMRELRNDRRKRGMVPLEVWIHTADAYRVRRYAAVLNRRRGLES